MLKINFEDFDRIYFGQIKYKYLPQSTKKFYCHFYPLYKFELDSWEKINFEEETSFLSEHNNFLLSLNDKSGAVNNGELKGNSRIINKKYCIILVKKEFLEEKRGFNGRKEVWINIRNLLKNRCIKYLSEFNLFPIISVNDFCENNVDFKKEEIFLEDWCLRFCWDYVYVYNSNEKMYYGKYRVVDYQKQLKLSLAPEQGYGIVNVCKKEDFDNNILELEDETYVFFWEKENISYKKIDVLTTENIYSVFMYLLRSGKFAISEKDISFLEEIGKLFIENVPKEFAEQRIEIVNKCINDFCVYSKILEESKDKMIKRVFDYILTCPEDKQNKYIDLCKQTLQKIENKKELD